MCCDVMQSLCRIRMVQCLPWALTSSNPGFRGEGPDELSLNSLRRGYIGDYIGEDYRGC